jgi:hypothetical protein
MSPLELFAQILGFIGAGICIFSFQIRNVRTLFCTQLISIIFFTVHFILLGAYTGALQNFLALVRCILLIFSNKKWAHNNWVLWGLIACFVISGIATYSGVLSLLPTIAMIVSTIAMWTNDGFKLRVAQVCVTSPAWLIYNVSVFSISGIITESFNIVSVIVSFIRYGKNIGKSDK